mgnify:CR=1 FL=1
MADRHNIVIANQFIAGTAADAASRPAYVLGDGDSGWYETADDLVSLSVNGVETIKVSGADVIFLANMRTTSPGSANGGGYLFVSGGSLQFVGSSGTVTRLAVP